MSAGSQRHRADAFTGDFLPSPATEGAGENIHTSNFTFMIFTFSKPIYVKKLRGWG